MIGVTWNVTLSHERKVRVLDQPCEPHTLASPFLKIWNFSEFYKLYMRIGKTLIRLRGCAGWSASFLCAHTVRHLFTWQKSVYSSVIQSSGCLSRMFLQTKADHGVIKKFSKGFRSNDSILINNYKEEMATSKPITTIKGREIIRSLWFS